MNILFLYDNPLVPEAGGTERATSLVMDELQIKGHVCYGFLEFIQYNDEYCIYEGEKINNLKLFLKDKNIDVVINQVGYHKWLLESFLRCGGSEWKADGGKIISVLHFDPSASYETLSSAWNTFKLLPTKKEKICSLHKVFFYKCCAYRQLIEAYEYIHFHSNCFVVLCNTYAEYIRERIKFLGKDKIHVIPNMLSFPNIVSTNILKEKAKSILVVSRMSEKQKHISKILKVWNKINPHDFILDIIGDGPDLEMYQNLVADRGVRNVVFHGRTNPLPYYQKASILLSTSPKEGWGLTITEAMQNGVVPIVLNTSAVFSEIIEDGVSGFLPNNMNDFRRKLELLMHDESKRIEMGKAGLQRSTLFSQEKVGEMWNCLIEEMFAER